MKARIFWSELLIGLFVLGPMAGLLHEGAAQNRRGAPSAKAPAKTLESVIPQDVAAVILLRDLDAFREGLQQSAFARTLVGTSLPLGRYLREILDRLDLSGAAHLGAGARYALVLPEAGDPPRTLVLAEAASRDRAARTAERLRVSLERLGSVRQLPGRSASIWHTSLTLQGEPVGFAHLDRVLLFGPTKSVERVLDAQAKMPKLSELPTFRLLQQRCARGTIFAFLNLERIMSFAIGRWTAQSPSGSMSLLVPLLQFVGLSAFKALGLSLAFEKGTALEEFHLVIDRGHNAMIAALSEAPAIEFATAHAIPEDAAFTVFMGLDLMRLYEAAVVTLGPLIATQLGGQSPESAIALLEVQLGFRIRDELLAAFGHEMALSRHPSSEQEELDIFLSVRNPDLLRSVLEKIAARQSARPIIYKTHTIYPLTDDRSIVVTSAEAMIARTERLKQILDHREHGRVLGRTSTFAHGMRQRPSGAIVGLLGTPAALHLSWFRPLRGGARSDEVATIVQALPDPLFVGFGVQDSAGWRGTLTSPLGWIILLDALLSVRSGVPEHSAFGALAHLIRLLADDIR
jgi:hypothetical protein